MTAVATDLIPVVVDPARVYHDIVHVNSLTLIHLGDRELLVLRRLDGSIHKVYGCRDLPNRALLAMTAICASEQPDERARSRCQEHLARLGYRLEESA